MKDFYQLLQLSTAVLKSKIKEAATKKEKHHLITALIVKNFLTILFCIIVVSIFQSCFGSENSIVGVITVIAILTFRFSNLDFETKQAGTVMAVIFGLLIIVPHYTVSCNPFLAWAINFVTILFILVTTCHNVILSNQFVYVLAFLLLYGNPTTDSVVFTNRATGLLVGALVVILVFTIKQRNIKFNRSFIDVIRDFGINDKRRHWQIKLAVGISLALFLARVLNIPYSMWIGFSVMSIMQPDKGKHNERVRKRHLHITVGSLIILGISLIVSKDKLGLFSIIGGLLAGFSGSYRWMTTFNCFGAVVSASSRLGVTGAALQRILNNILGAIFCLVFCYIYDKWVVYDEE